MARIGHLKARFRIDTHSSLLTHDRAFPISRGMQQDVYTQPVTHLAVGGIEAHPVSTT